MPSPVMSDVMRDFRDRVKEIENYFAYVTKLDENTINIVPITGTSLADLDSDSWIKTLKASCFLLMYNLIESTTKNAIQAIFDDLETNAIEFDTCRNEVRRIVINNLRRTNPDRILPAFSKLSVDIVVKTFDKHDLFSGNLDARRIRDVAKEYGFNNPRADGSQLLPVKTNRNDLAHGNKSFDEIGKVYGMDQLNTMQRDVKKYMEALLRNVDDYITNKQYLAPTTPII
ncbi:MAE_28990/MAE_18760 family HEPN-like nuclease [Spirosoma foliorum]|uniref:MAE-28990/MAE-18760-like HEPN domain-containing protein n=1 Tax=Spirosoma foliorum TaxID=2710596 RepID=A0A7G5GRM9_9BACT|nr:MAE_28990/MAE_18760 family HEPN-like nuclease [Spirosoma foliorum]QMW01521.1 hypothetical protein H3H32_26695 [Spirosoma foliorum]